MASQSTATSRLAQIQMRFQQKQLQEREQRKMEMTASKVTVTEAIDNEPIIAISTKSTATKSLDSSIGNGKVRQMFNERRRGAGIDRSNPLKPITSRSSSSSSAITQASVTSKNADNTFSRRQEITALRPINGRKVDKAAAKKLSTPYHDNGNDSVDYSYDENTRLAIKQETNHLEEDDLESETFPEQQNNFEFNLPAKLEALLLDDPLNDDKNNNLTSQPKPKPRVSAGIKLNPVLTKKSPPVVAARTPTRLSRTITEKPTPTKPKITEKSSPKMTKPLANSKPVRATKWVQRAKTPPTHAPGTAPCRICNRYFIEDRLTKHEEVCERMAMKKRKIFDASKHRVKGTEAEKFLKKPIRASKPASIAAKASTTSTTTPATDTSKKSNWRIKHEEFIAAIRAAKQVQAYIAKGGKLSDLPPPPRSENPDYITCPHCSRRFNEAAATRHIPKCANMMHNKPKPKPAAKRR